MTTRTLSRLCITLIVSACMISTSHAHFMWLTVETPSSDKPTAHVYFSESPEPDDPALLKRLGDVSVKTLSSDGKVSKTELKLGEESLTATLPESDALHVLSHTYGTFSRGGPTMLLNYRCKTGPVLGHQTWQQNSRELLDLDLVPQRDGKEIQVKVYWKGEPASGVQVVAVDPNFQDYEMETDKTGVVSIPASDAGRYTFRARVIEEKAGKYKDTDYSAARYYTTLVLPVEEEARILVGKQLPVVPKPVASFGAATIGTDLYMYGGAMGTAHSYDNTTQGDTLWKLNLKKPGGWENLSQGPRLQGLAMVSHDGKLYRVGGFTAKNEVGEDHDLWSQTSFASYDPKSGEWTDLSPLPEPRSSHDAAVIGDTLYVVGGWNMQGPDNTMWHTTAWSCDLSSEQKEWKELPHPPFKRRALSLAAHNGQLYCVGGMQESGGPTREVSVFNPDKGTWSEGPTLPGEKSLAGFGSSSFATGDELYVSTIEGKLFRLSTDGKAWQRVGDLERARFFHRMLPVSDSQLLFVGGANMGIGKFEEVEIVDLPSDQ